MPFLTLPLFGNSRKHSVGDNGTLLLGRLWPQLINQHWAWSHSWCRGIATMASCFISKSLLISVLNFDCWLEKQNGELKLRQSTEQWKWILGTVSQTADEIIRVLPGSSPSHSSCYTLHYTEVPTTWATTSYISQKGQTSIDRCLVHTINSTKASTTHNPFINTSTCYSNRHKTQTLVQITLKITLKYYCYHTINILIITDYLSTISCAENMMFLFCFAS